MRINKYIAQSTALSRRGADEAVNQGRVTINGIAATAGAHVAPEDVVMLDNRTITPDVKTTLLLHKPIGYVCSRAGQGSRTIYELLPARYHRLKPVGRLDKDSSGLLLLTNDGALAYELTHPSRRKVKVYEVNLDHPLQPLHRQMISDHGVTLEDGPSKLGLERLDQANDTRWQVTMHEGRNRQIRRTFAALGYSVTALHRTTFGSYQLNDLAPGAYQELA